jgi:hypothetical protein
VEGDTLPEDVPEPTPHRGKRGDDSGVGTVPDRDAPLPEDEPGGYGEPIRPPLPRRANPTEDRDAARRKALMAKFRGMGYGATGDTDAGRVDRARRLEITSAIVGRPLASSTELTPEEVSVVLHALDMVDANPDALTYDADGSLRYAP